jgi:hypothetical protein
MASFRIHRMRPHVKINFRWAPHVAGLAIVKQRDYLPGGEFEAPDEYALWADLRNSDDKLEVGDLVERSGAEDTVGGLKICKFVGFEAAKWAETEPGVSPSVTEAGPPVTAGDPSAAPHLN